MRKSHPFPSQALALPSLVVVAKLEERWHRVGFETTAVRGYACLALSQLAWGPGWCFLPSLSRLTSFRVGLSEREITTRESLGRTTPLGLEAVEER